MRAIVLLLAAMLPAAAQFTSLRTDYRGDQLFFISTLNYKGQAPGQGGKVYVADSSGIHLLFALEREWQTYPSLPPNLGTTNYYDTISIDRASNGEAFALTTVRECQLGGASCISNDQRFTTIFNNQGQPIAGEIGPGRVSRNGEWATVGSYRINLKTGQRRYIGYRQAIADNGTVLIFPDTNIASQALPVEFLRTDGYRYEFGELGTQGTINADGTIGAWVSNGQVRRVDLKPYTPEVITAGEGSNPQLSDDGSKLMFLSNRQIQLYANGTAKPVTLEQSGVTEATISGDGQVIWYVTGHGEVKRTSLSTSETKTFTGPVAAFLDRHIITSAGSATLLRASVSRGQRVKATLRGEPVPVIQVEDNQLYLQVPWETPKPAYYPLTLEGESGLDWTGASMSLGVVSAAPRFLPDPTGKYALTAHQDFHGLITTDDPAIPGEIVHLYAAGLGPVTPRVPTGVPSPLSPPAEVKPFVPICYVNPLIPSSQMDIVWAGLAPGLIGTYQLDFRVPADAKGTTLDIWCRGDDLGARSPLPLRGAPQNPRVTAKAPEDPTKDRHGAILGTTDTGSDRLAGAKALSTTTIPTASALDTVGVLAEVVLPTLSKGAIIRPPRVLALAEFLDLDHGAVTRMQRVRNKYGSEPLMLAIPGRRIALVLNPSDVHRVLEQSPDPFATDTKENGQSDRSVVPRMVARKRRWCWQS